jgi:hypothetical protein
MDASHVTRGYLIALAGTAIWFTTAIFIRDLTVHYRSITHFGPLPWRWMVRLWQPS